MKIEICYIINIIAVACLFTISKLTVSTYVETVAVKLKNRLSAVKL